MNTLNFLGIYETAINNAVEVSESALKEVRLENKIDDLHNSIEECLKEIGDWENITNSIIYAYFSTAESIIEEEYGEEKKIDFYINCDDSHFYINNEEVF